jgi:hypothetical protein
MRKTIFFLLLSTSILLGQSAHQHTRKIQFPNIPGHLTIVSDLHQHTVFSDGNVWPSIRIEEAARDGVDLISLTEHLEYQPHKEDIPHPDRNRSYNLAKAAAESSRIMVVPGSEITRNLPPGHNNALFITDANQLLVEDSIEVFRAAQAQGAFVFWNHPNWIAQEKNGIAKITPTQQYLIDNGLLHGIEVVNEHTFSEEALQIALEHHLTIMATSDIHGLIDWEFEVNEGGHRPVTLIFSQSKEQESIKKALFERKTVAYFNNYLIGRAEYLEPLVKACLVIKDASFIGNSTVVKVTIENKSNAPFILLNQSSYTFHEHADLIEIPASGTIELAIKTLGKNKNIILPFEVINGIVAPKKYANITLDIDFD